MSRFTREIQQWEIETYNPTRPNNDKFIRGDYMCKKSAYDRDILNKLGKLEDAEELCIEMTTQPIYEVIDDEIEQFDFTGYSAAYDFKNNCIIVYNFKKAIKHAIYFINEYGKTWALTKEELENEN